MNSSSTIRIPSLIAIVICAILWFSSPFVAVNLITLGKQPSALQLVTGDFFHIGNLSDSPAYWAAVFSIGGIIVCFICDIVKISIVSRIVAVVAEIPMIQAMVNVYRWADGDMERLFDMLGMGFWGIFLLFFVVILISGKKLSVHQENSAAGPLVEPSAQPPEELPVQTIYCENCGAKIKPGMKFCEKCGSPISQD